MGGIIAASDGVMGILSPIVSGLTALGGVALGFYMRSWGRVTIVFSRWGCWLQDEATAYYGPLKTDGVLTRFVFSVDVFNNSDEPKGMANLRAYFEKNGSVIASVPLDPDNRGDYTPWLLCDTGSTGHLPPTTHLTIPPKQWIRFTLWGYLSPEARHKTAGWDNVYFIGDLPGGKRKVRRQLIANRTTPNTSGNPDSF